MGAWGGWPSGGKLLLDAADGSCDGWGPLGGVVSPRGDRRLPVEAVATLVQSVVLRSHWIGNPPPTGERKTAYAIHPSVRTGGCPVEALEANSGRRRRD